jgi:CTP synthase
MKKKYIFVTGGVFSSLGKGIISAAIGKIFINQKKKVFIQKLDPYFNLNAGKMNPFQHGEVYVTKDGYETDLDLGHYERFLEEELLGKYANVTAGQIYSRVLKKEEKGQYRGETIQTMPHITSEIKRKIYEVHSSLSKEILIVEIGGTVGDIESLSFLEACRQIKNEVGSENVVFIHVVYLPFLKTSREFKTKPAQHSVKQLLTCGIQPQIIICRSDQKTELKILEKISLLCNVEKQYVFNVPNLKSIYEVPFVLEKQKLGKKICTFLNLNFDTTPLQKNEQISKTLANNQTITIKIFGKYGTFPDNYLSIVENLKFASQKEKVKLKIEIVDVMKIN